MAGRGYSRRQLLANAAIAASRGLVAVRRTRDVAAVTARPHPRPALRRNRHQKDATDNHAVFEHAVIVDMGLEDLTGCFRTWTDETWINRNAGAMPLLMALRGCPTSSYLRAPPAVLSQWSGASLCGCSPARSMFSASASGLCRERRLHRAQKRLNHKVTPTPGEACAEERQGSEQSKVSRRLGVRSRSRMERSAHLAGCRKVKTRNGVTRR